MGQQIGKASFEEDVKPFLNLSAPAINAVWTAFNLSAEAWGLRASSFVNICRPLAPFLGFDDPTLQIKAAALFTLLDTDLNGVVDALEFMGCLAMVSAMEPADKIKFVYTVYDFSEKGSLLVDEITLAVKSTVEGLCKVSKLPAPGVSACENLARLAFAANGKAAVVSSGGTLTLAEFLAYVDANPTAASWVGYFDDIPDSGVEAPVPASVFVSPVYPARSAVEAGFLAGRGPPASLGPKTGGGEWYRPPVVDESYIPGEGDDVPGGGGEEEASVKYLDPGTPCFAAVQQLLKPEEVRRTVLTSPDSQLVLDWVHGVSTLGRQHVKYCGGGGGDGGESVVYPAGAVAVQYRFPNEEGEEAEAVQRHFTDHADSITALAVAPNNATTADNTGNKNKQGGSSAGTMVATADCRSGFGGPRVMLWRARKDANSPAGVLGGGGLWGDGCPPFALDFSPDGSKLLAVAKSASASGSASSVNASYFVTVHDVNTKSCVFALTTTSSSFGQVFDGKWCSTLEKGTYMYAKGGVQVDGPQGSFALATSKGIVFFAPTPGGASSFEPRKGVAGNRTKVEALLSLCALEEPEAMACGSMSGNLYRYEGRNVAECVSAHNGPITCLKYVTAAQNAAGGGVGRLFSGSMDATVKVWDLRTLAPVATLDLMALGSSLGREVLSVDVGGNGAKCLVATSAAEVWELSAVGGSGGEDGEDPEDGGGGGDDDEGGGAGSPPGKSLHPGGGPLFNGHFGVRGSGLVTCLAASPSATEYASGGSDGTLRIYDSATHQVARLQQLTAGVSSQAGGGVRCLAYSSDGAQLAAAVGGSVEVFDPNTLEARLARLPADADDSNVSSLSPIQLLRFSPDGGSLAVLDENAQLSLYLSGSWSLMRVIDLAQHLPPDSLKPPAKSKGSNSSSATGIVTAKSRCPGVCDVDLSDDGAWVQVGTNLLETFYFATETGKLAAEPVLTTLRNASCRFSSCGPGASKIAHEKQGSHPAHCAPGDVTVCCASPEARLQLCGDAWGGVHLFNYPSSAPATEGQTWQCHSPGVNGACFVSGDEHVATCGSSDLVVLQWKLDVDEVRDKPKEPEDEDGGGGDGEDEDDGAGGPKLQDVDDPVEEGEDYLGGAALGQGDKDPLFVALVTRDAKATTALVAAEAQSNGGDLYKKSSSLFAAAVAPTFQQPSSLKLDPPKEGLSLEWVHGMGAQGVRGGVRYNSFGEIVYPAATLAVVLNKGIPAVGDNDEGNNDSASAAEAADEVMSQRYLAAHTEAVTCLAVHPAGLLVATGQRGPNPFVALSDSATGRVCCRLYPALKEGVEAGAVSAVAFSPDGSLVSFATCDEGAFTLHVFGTDDGTLRCQGPSGAEGKVLGLSWAPDSSGRILACGVEHFNLWFCRGRSLARKRGVFGAEAIKQTMLCCAWIPGPAGANGGGDEDGPGAIGVLGGQDGGIYKLDGRSISEAVEKVHVGGVTALYAFTPFEDPEGPCLCSGGRDGVVKLMTPDCEAAVTINLRDKKYGCNRWHVKSVCLNKDGRKVLIGTNGSEVFEISATEEAVDLNGGCLVTGHCRKSLRGIAAHPMQPEYCTVGEDRTIRLWSAGAKKLSRMLSLSGEARSCCYSPDGYLVAVGMADGSVQVVSLLKPQLDVVKELKVEGGAGPVTGVRFSPSGKVLACATDAGPDGSRVVFYDCENTATPGGAFTLKSKFVLAAVTDAANKAASSGANAAANGLVTPPPFELSSPAAMDFSGDSSTLQLATSFGVVYVTVDSGACVGMAAASSLSVQRSGAGLPAPSMEEACQAVLRQGATQYRDETWASYTLPSGWAARGVYRPGAQGGDVVSVCRGTSGGGNLACAADAFGCLSLVSWPCPSSSEANDDSGGGEGGGGEGGFTASLSADGGSSGLEAATSNNNIAVGGGGGEAPKRQYWGHGAAMGGACFVVGDTHVVSIGADDRCVFQWATGKPSVEALAKLQVEEAKAKELAAKMEAAAKAKAEQDDDLDWEAAEAAEKKKKLAEEEALTASDDAATDPEVVVSLAAKPPKFTSNAQPPDLAKLSFVQGLSTLRGGAFVNADGHVLHCAGSLGVVYVKKRHAQLVFSGHHDNLDHNGNGGGAPIVRVLACQADVGFRFGACAASGDASGGVCVWDACTAASRSSLPQGLHTGSEISALGFSNSSHRLGSFLVSVGSDQRHTLGVWQSPKQDWTDPVLVCSAQVGGGLVSFCAWAASSGSAHSGGRKGRAAPQEQYDFCVGGAAKVKGSSSNSSGVQFWSLSCGNAKCVSGTYAEGVVEEDLNVCGVGLGKSPAEGMGHLQLMATGGASGRILLWEGTTCVRVSAKAHASAVTDLKVAPLDVSPRKPKDAAPGRYKGRMGLVSGGLDGVVKVWAVSGVGGDATLALSSAFDVSNECVPRPLRSSVCAVAVDGPFTKMLVVTESSELLEVVRDSRATVQLLAAHAPALTDGTGPEEGPAAHTGGGNGGGGVSGGVARGVVDPVAPHPSEPDLLASGGSDGTVRVWSRSGRCGLAVLEVGNPVAAVCWVPDPPDAASTGACGGLLVSIAPSGSLVQISVDLGTMVLAKAKVVSPSQTPVPHALMVDTEGKMIKAFASPKDKQPTFLEMSNGKPLAEVSAAAKSTWYGDSKAGESSSSSGGSDADGACLFMY